MCLSDEDLWRPLGRLIFLSILFLNLFSGCSKNGCGDNKNINSSFNKNSLADSVKLKEAKYSDIPIPVGYSFVDLKSKNSLSFSTNLEDKVDVASDCFCCAGDLSLIKVLNYYKASMECCGWDITDLSTDKEGLLFCNKQSRCCVVSVRNANSILKNTKNNTCVLLFVKNKLLEKGNRIKDINSKKLEDIVVN